MHMVEVVSAFKLAETGAPGNGMPAPQLMQRVSVKQIGSSSRATS